MYIYTYVGYLYTDGRYTENLGSANNRLLFQVPSRDVTDNSKYSNLKKNLYNKHVDHSSVIYVEIELLELLNGTILIYHSKNYMTRQT